MALSAIGSTASLKAVAYYTTAVFVIGAIILLVAQDVVDAPPIPNTIDRLKVYEDWWEKFQNDSGGSGGGKPGWGIIILTVISILILTGQFIPPATDTVNPPPTEEPNFVRVRHYSSSINSIKSQMTIKSTYGYSIWAEYPISTSYKEADIRNTVIRFGRNPDTINGFVEFDVDLQKWRLEADPNLPPGSNAVMIPLVTLDGNMSYLGNGFPLFDASPAFYDNKGSVLR
jgi:hypothetical protein